MKYNFVECPVQNDKHYNPPINLSLILTLKIEFWGKDDFAIIFYPTHSKPAFQKSWRFKSEKVAKDVYQNIIDGKL